MDSKLEEILQKYEIVDSHLHLGVLGYMNVAGKADTYIMELIEKYSLKYAVFSHHAALCSLSFGWKKTLEALGKSDKLYAYVVFNPNFCDFSMDIISQNIGRERFTGIKIHPSWHKCYPHNERYKKFWEYADQNGLVVLTHSWNPDVANRDQKYSDPFFFEPIARKYKNIKLILAHGGGRGEYLYRVMDILKDNENIYVDFAGDIFVPGLLEKYVKKAGSERILFGTDMPWSDIRYHLLWIEEANIGENDKRNIFGLNAGRLFNIR
ncbi:MAG: amidohydrolase family protein [Actinomycetota bacterium]